jgi:hypothetical protein
MYDDWAYRADTLAEPVSRPSPPVQKTTRPRARSLLQEVALAGPSKTPVSAPRLMPLSEADVPLRRANSVVNLRTSIDHIGMLKMHPLNRKEKKELDHLSRWLTDDDVEAEILVLNQSYSQDLELANSYEYVSFRDAAHLHARACTQLLDRADQVLQYLDTLAQGFREVRASTSEFEQACHNLVSEKNHLAELASDLDHNLEIFTALERVSRKLNTPGSDLPGRSSFKPLLEDLDRGLDYVQKHPKFIDIDLYQMRYRQCMTRALTLAQDHFNDRLRLISKNIHDKITASKTLNPTAHSALLYASFETDAPALKEVVTQISSRCEGHREYNELFGECLRTYFGIRHKLLTPMIFKSFDESAIKDPKTPFVQACRTNLAFFKDIYLQEYRLFRLFFEAAPETSFLQWLGDLSEPLYDLLRQRIIREGSIDNLCELTSLLLSYENDDDELNEDKLTTSGWFGPVLEDVQSRLVFRVQTIVEQDIVRYVPKADDISQLGRRRKKSLVESNESTQHDFDTEQLLQGLYPPMKRAVTLLSQIYQLVNSKVFDDLAHRVVHESMVALQRAFSLAVARLGPIEAELFQIKNLLMLRSQILGFDIESAPAEVQIDFSGIQEVFTLVRQEGVSFTSSSLLNLARAGVPKVVNNMLDAKEELYAKLKNAIQDFTEGTVKTVAKSILENPSVESAVENSRKLRQDAAVELPRIRTMIENYISDDRTIDILMDSIQDLVIQTYDKYKGQVEDNSTSNEQIDGMMEVDGLMSWLGDIIGRLHSERSRSSSAVSRTLSH